MYKRMLVPLDGSKLAESVFVYAKELAGRLDLDMTLFHVCPQAEQELVSMHQAYIERAVESIRKQAEEVQQQTRTQSGVKALEVRGEMAVGHPAEEILRYADENNIDLVLLATHGHSGVRRWVMGSVADKVLRASKAPVWLVRAGIPEEVVHDQLPTRTLLAPLDGSELAESLLPHIEALVKQRGAELVEIVLIRVCEAPFITADYPDSAMRLTWEEHVEYIKSMFRAGCEDYLQKVAARLRDTGLNVRSEVLMGDPADEITNYVTKYPFNLIAMSTHGRSGLKRWAYGSVANKVLHGVNIPIFLVRPQQL
jgi:nucleotide-binding universal stress UspA family protein